MKRQSMEWEPHHMTRRSHKRQKMENPVVNQKIDISNVNNTTEFDSHVSDKDITMRTRCGGAAGVRDGGSRVDGTYISSKKTAIGKGKNNSSVDEPLTEEELILEKKKIATAYYKEKNYNLALSTYSELIRQCLVSESFYGNRAACYMMLGRYENALRDAKKAIELNPEYIKGHLRVIKSAMALGNFLEAEIGMRHLETVDPGNALLVSERMKIAEIRRYLMKADDASNGKNYIEALRNINKVIEISTHCVSYKIKKGEYLAFLERYKDAEIVANDILRYEPSNVDAKYILGLCIYQSDADKAVFYFKDILHMVPDDPKIIVIYKKAKAFAAIKNNGNDAFRKKNYNEAYKLYTEALKIDPENRGMNKKLYYNQSQASYKLGNVQRAILECSKALAIDPTYVKALMRRGQCYIDQKKYEAAVSDLRKACEIDSSKDCRNLFNFAKKLLNAATSDHHGILGVKQNASQLEIRKAYKSKALLHHPDRHVNSSSVEKAKNEKIFKQITQAYRLLKNWGE